MGDGDGMHCLKQMCRGRKPGSRSDGLWELPEARLRAKPVIMPMIAPALRGVARERAEQEDAEQAAVGDGGDGEADLDDVAFAAGVDA